MSDTLDEILDDLTDQYDVIDMNEYTDKKTYFAELEAIKSEAKAHILKAEKIKIDKALKAGFYAGQAMAGRELNECHKNWKEWNNPSDSYEPRSNFYD